VDNSSWRKPAAKMVQPKARPSSEESADEKDAAEVQAALQRREAEQKRAEDKIGALIGAEWFITNWTNPVLIHPSLPQLSVSRYYPTKRIAVDIFTHIGDWERSLIEYKRKAFKEREVTDAGVTGIVRYGALCYSDQLASLLPQLEA
jgi:hypothetical protein